MARQWFRFNVILVTYMRIDRNDLISLFSIIYINQPETYAASVHFTVQICVHCKLEAGQTRLNLIGSKIFAPCLFDQESGYPDKFNSKNH